jgi:hypothetical protein
MTSIGWIDFSPSQRDRVGSVLDLLSPEGMVDELGMGTIRDALANEMFPGISTIQTRAKYFFIIPYILYDFQIAKPAQRKGKLPSKYLEDREYEIMWELAATYDYIEGKGVIGISKKKPNKIVRRPSTIYWNGLYTYQFIDTKGLGTDLFLDQTVKSSMESLLSKVLSTDDTMGDDLDAEHENTFRIKVPIKLNWTENLNLDLSQEEAEFFRDRIRSVAKGKLIAELLTDDKLWQIFLDSKNFMEFAHAAQSLPLKENLKSILILANDFSELMYGAHVTYNCLLHNEVFNSDNFDEEKEHWLYYIKDNMIDFNSFNPDNLFTYALTTRTTTMKFVKDWWKLTLNKENDMKKLRKMIEFQEASVKGSKARLRWKKTEDVRENKWIGLSYLGYRFNQVRTIITDIRTGLKNNASS